MSSKKINWKTSRDNEEISAFSTRSATFKKRTKWLTSLIKAGKVCEHTISWLETTNLKCHTNNRESVAGFVIQATGTVEFEDGFGTGVVPGGC